MKLGNCYLCGEEDHKCAIREVLEETGFDVSSLINKVEYVEMIFGPQRVRLYIVGGVKEDTTFAPQTKKEISEVEKQVKAKTKEESGACKTLCYPIDQPELPEGTLCFVSGKPAKKWTYWERSY